MSRFPSAAPAHAAPDLSRDVPRAALVMRTAIPTAATAIAMITAWSTRPKKKMWHAITHIGERQLNSRRCIKGYRNN